MVPEELAAAEEALDGETMPRRRPQVAGQERGSGEERRGGNTTARKEGSGREHGPAR